jgi:hypothetical protein
MSSGCSIRRDPGARTKIATLGANCPGSRLLRPHEECARSAGMTGRARVDVLATPAPEVMRMGERGAGSPRVIRIYVTRRTMLEACLRHDAPPMPKACLRHDPGFAPEEAKFRRRAPLLAAASPVPAPGGRRTASPAHPSGLGPAPRYPDASRRRPQRSGMWEVYARNWRRGQVYSPRPSPQHAGGISWT